MKMMVLNNDFSKIFEPLFEIDSVRSGTSGPTNQFPVQQISGPLWTVRNQTSERTCLNAENGTWETSFSLEMLPTKPSELKVKVEDRKLIVTGKSETETKRDGFEIKSKHDWSRKINIPNFVDPKSIKIKLSEDKIVKIFAEKKNEDSNDIEIMIE